jgi:ATP/maltotriose-dependent transcriptional regulator MalT
VAAEQLDCLFGRCNLARLLIMDGEFEEAQSLLRGLAVERERTRCYDMFTLYGTLAMLHTAKGDDTAAQRFLASLEPLLETEDDERRFTQARELVNWVMPKGVFGSILRRMASLSPQPDKRRR